MSHRSPRAGEFERRVAMLLTRAGSGDRQAMAEVFEATSAIVYGLVLRIVGQRPTADDVLGEVYLQAWRDAGRFDPQRGSALAWLAAIARTRAIDTLRRHNGKAGEPIDAAALIVSGEPGPEENGFAAERSRRVRGAMQNLSPAQREVIEMAYYQGYSQSQIAERLGQPLGTIKTRVRAAMRTLRDHLLDLDESEQEGAEPGCHEKAEG